MDNDELELYYHTQGERLLYALAHIGVISQSELEGERFNILAEYIGMELQEVANSAIRWHTLLDRAKAIKQERETKEAKTDPPVFVELDGQSSCTVAGCDCGTSDVPLHKRHGQDGARANFIKGACGDCLARMKQEESEGDVFDPTYAQCTNDYCKWYKFAERSNYKDVDEYLQYSTDTLGDG